MPTAEIISIGTELLLGDIQDTNTQYIARNLREAGIDLYRATIVGDNLQRIAQAIQEALQRAEIIITTGGLGPTVDDPTREAVAAACGVKVEYRPELWSQIQERFQRYGRTPTENNRKQAYIPLGAEAIENTVGTAPAFVIKKNGCLVFSLPGVPSEMVYLLDHAVLPYINKHFELHNVIKERVLHTSGIGESMVDDRIADLEQLSNPTVGLLAHSGQVDVRIVAKAESTQEADKMIQVIEDDLRHRLGKWIYGTDTDTLEDIAMDALRQRNWTLCVVEAGLGGALIGRLANIRGPFLGGEMDGQIGNESDLRQSTLTFRQARNAEVALGVLLIPGKEKQDIWIYLVTPEGETLYNRPYGGPPNYAPRWAVNHSLHLIREHHPNQTGQLTEKT